MFSLWLVCEHDKHRSFQHPICPNISWFQTTVGENPFLHSPMFNIQECCGFELDSILPTSFPRPCKESCQLSACFHISVLTEINLHWTGSRKREIGHWLKLGYLSSPTGGGDSTSRIDWLLECLTTNMLYCGCFALCRPNPWARFYLVKLHRGHHMKETFSDTAWTFRRAVPSVWGWTWIVLYSLVWWSVSFSPVSPQRPLLKLDASLSEVQPAGSSGPTTIWIRKCFQCGLWSSRSFRNELKEVFQEHPCACVGEYKSKAPDVWSVFWDVHKFNVATLKHPPDWSRAPLLLSEKGATNRTELHHLVGPTSTCSFECLWACQC